MPFLKLKSISQVLQPLARTFKLANTHWKHFSKPVKWGDGTEIPSRSAERWVQAISAPTGSWRRFFPGEALFAVLTPRTIWAVHKQHSDCQAQNISKPHLSKFYQWTPPPWILLTYFIINLLQYVTFKTMAVFTSCMKWWWPWFTGDHTVKPPSSGHSAL